ncbi:hypothetical protein RN001_002156 [Aquatica leii]|uniref:Long-chain-fatty-acid--CoA ligase n=1 Tax=Aquatica leii TaxID=1421715 RepID=A0AAN7SSS5_9COLE|nr:hypothetical protein RN001_002156 [Aquatica leii]
MWNTLVLAIVVLPVIALKYNWIKNAWKKIKRDLLFIKSVLTVISEMRKILKENEPVHKRFESLVKTYPNKTAILFEDETWTFAQVEEFANKVAIYFEQQGYRQGDCVAILLQNCPEYTCLWLGLSKIDSLLHSIKIVNCKAIIFGSCFQEVISSVMTELPLKGYEFNRFNETNPISMSYIDLSQQLSAINPKKPLQNAYTILPHNPLLYVYTSGTTGLSKAAILTHFRYNLFRCAGKAIFENTANTVIYCPMPLYHGSGVAIGMGQMVLSGSTVALRKKFSASNYWKDCKKYNCNAAQYIGEMLRYVLMVPENENVDHSLDLIYGNGLKPQIWKEFITKFKVKRVAEFYASTEGNFALYNIDNSVGNTGYIPPYLRKLLPFKLVRFSEEKQEPVRDTNGFCIECKENEPGLAIGKINQGKSVLSLLHFRGYTDKKESSKKILFDVFQKGDRFYNSGDLLWKGENVSTTEIEAIISKIINLNDAVVYGVQIPGTEGRAGMVSLVNPGNKFNVDFLLEKFKERIAPYAIPMFLRFIRGLPLTSTFKLQKYNLRSEEICTFNRRHIQQHYDRQC